MAALECDIPPCGAADGLEAEVTEAQIVYAQRGKEAEVDERSVVGGVAGSLERRTAATRAEQTSR